MADTSAFDPRANPKATVPISIPSAISTPIGPTGFGAARRQGAGWLFLTPALLLLTVIGLPLMALVIRAVQEGAFGRKLVSDYVFDALRLSAISTSVTLVVAVATGTPLAFALARRRFRGRQLVETLVDLPLVLPPVVAGIALLVAFGRRGLLGGELSALGITLPFTLAAVILAQIFVAVPFYVRSAKVGFAAVPREVEEAAALDGASAWRSFRDVTVPLAMPGIGAGMVLCWARALSEFGATLLFAGNLRGTTQTMPLAIMGAFERSLGEALALAVLLLTISAAVLIATRSLGSEVDGSSAG